MLPEASTALASLALTVYEQIGATDARHLFPMPDAILEEVYRLSILPSECDADIKTSISSVLVESDFSQLLTKRGDLTPMVVTASGSFRITPHLLLSSLFTSASIQIFLLRQSNNESAFVETVLRNYEELRKAVRGEAVNAYFITGLSGISLSETSQASTPWGVLRSAPRVQESETLEAVQLVSPRPKTTCTLIEDKRIAVRFDTSTNPRHSFDDLDRKHPKVRLLFHCHAY